MVTRYAVLHFSGRIKRISADNEQDSIAVTDENIISHPVNYRYLNNYWVEDLPPSPCHSIDANGEWYLDNTILNEARSYVCDQIKTYRESRKMAGVFVMGKWFHSDEKSRTQWLGLKDKAKDALANGGDNQTQLTINHPQYGLVPINWVTMDGSTKLVTVELAFAVFEKIGDLDGLHHGIAVSYINQVQNSSNPESIDYKQNANKTNWPPIYGE